MGSRQTVAALLLATALPSAALATEPPEVSARLGVPYYFSFYGRSADPNDSSVQFFGHLAADVTWNFARLVRVGGVAAGSLVLGEISGVDGHVYAAGFGPIAQIHSERLNEVVVAGLAMSPRLLFYGARADRNLKKHSTALGVDAEVSVRVRITPQLRVGVFGGMGMYGAPLSDGRWFNEPLGRTNIAHIDVGVSWQFD